MIEKNDLVNFFQQAANDMQEEYERIRKDSQNDSGTAGDEGEENWANLLREWLPKDYHIVTKGKIIFEDGSLSPQMDVIVLKSCYPQGLIRRNVKKYLAHCVAAAFECKLTLRKEHFSKFFANSRILKTKIKYDPTSPYKELHGPIIYGLLAHTSQVKKSLNKSHQDIISQEIRERDLTCIQHPVEMPDLFCVADIATWTAFKSSYLGPNVFSAWSKIAHVYNGEDHASTSYILYQPASSEEMENFTPIGNFICSLTYKLAWSNQSLRDLALYYLLSKITGGGKGISGRRWNPRTIYSDKIASSVIAGHVKNGKHWDEWSFAFL